MSYSMSPPPPQKAAPSPYTSYPPQSTSPPNPSPYGPPPAKRARISPDPRSPPNGAGPAWPPPQHNIPNVGAYGNPYAPHSAVQSPYATTPTPPYGAQSPQQQHNSFNTPQAYPYPSPPPPWQSQPPTPAPAAPSQNQMSPTSQQSREMMPPPPKPQREEREEKVGVDEIRDSLYGSGINLKEEESYLHAIYNNRHHHQPHPSTAAMTQDTSFTSTNHASSSFGSSTMSPNNSFNMLTQNTSFSGEGRSQDAAAAAAAFAGTLGQPLSQEEVELEQRRKREVAARDQAERRQHHLNNQFLECNNVRKRMDDLAREYHVVLHMNGVFIRQVADPAVPAPQPAAAAPGAAAEQQQQQPRTSVMLNGAATEGIVATSENVPLPAPAEDRPESVVNQHAPFEQIVSLISLAAGERIRGLLDEAFTLARARQYGDHGRVVPVEFADLAVGEGKRGEVESVVVGEGITGSAWEGARGARTADGEEGEEGAEEGPEKVSPTPPIQSTVSFAGNLNAALRALAEKDREAEKSRLAKREARKKRLENAQNALTDSGSPPPTATADASSAANAATADATPATAAAAGSGADQPKMTKKEQLRQQKEKASSNEAALHLSTNQTAAMMALGKKGSRYSWMTGGVAAMPTNRFAKAGGGGSGVATPVSGGTVGKDGGAAAGGGGGGGGSGAVTPGGSGTVGVEGGEKDGDAGMVGWGEWREEGRKGVELRDWVLVLERDGRERAALVKAVAGLK